MTKIRYKFLVYNPRTDEIGVPIMIDNIMLVDVGYVAGVRVLTAEWQQIGFL